MIDTELIKLHRKKVTINSFLDRDEFMVCNAAQIIAYYDGRERGGTYYTIRKAREMGISVTNLY